MLSVIFLQGGWSSLMIASEKGHLDIMKTLIGAGAEVSLTNEVVTLLLMGCSSVRCLMVAATVEGHLLIL